eukprot:m.16171 g.16171  ORF g.16171 m.16171 type:complete len:497 (+) comp5174_c1_seq1:152-1642(+)
MATDFVPPTVPTGFLDTIHSIIFPYFGHAVVNTSWPLSWPVFATSMAVAGVGAYVRGKLAHSSWLPTLKFAHSSVMLAVDASLMWSMYNFVTDNDYGLIGNVPTAAANVAGAQLITSYWTRVLLDKIVCCALRSNGAASILTSLPRFIALRHEASGQMIILVMLGLATTMAFNAVSLLNYLRVENTTVARLQRGINKLGTQLEQAAASASFFRGMYYPPWHQSMHTLVQLPILLLGRWANNSLTGTTNLIANLITATMFLVFWSNTHVQVNGNIGGNATPNWLPGVSDTDTSPEAQQRRRDEQRVRQIRTSNPDLFSHQECYKLVQLFDTVDVNSDEKIDRSELRSLLHRVNPEAEGRVDQVLSEVDADDSGDLDFSEFVAIAAQVRQHALDAEQSVPSQLGRYMRQMSAAGFLSDVSRIASHASQDGANDEDRLCVICLTNERELMVKPCNHLCMCLTCAELMNKHADEQTAGVQYSKCPVCRTPVTGTARVFLS